MSVSRPSAELPQILYIMGTGRSGSTILEVLLGNSPGIHQAGEVTHIYKDGLLRGRNCACGVKATECPVWGPVLKSVTQQMGTGTYLRSLHESVEGHGRFPFTFAGLGSSTTLNNYRQANYLIFQELRLQTDASVVVDSSKYVGRALALSRTLPTQVRVVFLTRSPVALIRAFAKNHKDEQLPKSPAKVAIYYCWVLLCARAAAFSSRAEFFVLSYEKLQEDPVGTLDRIGRWAALDLSESRRLLQQDEELRIGHLVTANRLRYQEAVRFTASRPAVRLEGVGQKLASVLMTTWQAMLGWAPDRT